MSDDTADRLTRQVREDLLDRGYSRRSLAKLAGVFGVAAAAATAGRPAWAGLGAPGPASGARVRIGANECWTGPLEPGQRAAASIIASGNRYSPNNERGGFIRAVTAVEGAPGDHVAPWPGSSDPLSRAVVTFCSPKRGLVTADPTFELAGETAEWLGAPVKRVPLKPDLSHDVRAMVAADPNAGLFYVVSPNNPTGTVTPVADIEWLIANKPAGSYVLVDEAYTHFADIPVCSPMVTAGKDVIVLRTFSKLFGMAGMRMGYCMARPDLLERMMRYDGGMQSGALPLPSLTCATASLTAGSLIAARRQEMRETRAMTLSFLEKRGLKVLPTNANMFMIDWGSKPAHTMQALYRAQSVEIGRSWPIWPTASRITVGSMEDMRDFCKATDAVLAKA